MPPRPPRLGALWLVALAAGCSSLLPTGQIVRYPSDQAVAAAGVTIGCEATSALCIQEVSADILELARNLELPYAGPGVTDPRAPDLAGTLTVVYSGPDFAWGAADGSSGTASTIAVDLAPLLRQSSAYAVLATQGGTIRYSLPLGQAHQLLATIVIVPDPFAQ